MSLKFPSFPNLTQIQDDSGQISAPWLQYLSSLDNVVRPKSGTTAQRPTKGLYPGLFYFDQSLGANGKPIWVNKAGTGWVDATGTAA